MENEIQTEVNPTKWAVNHYKYLFNFSMSRVKDRQKAEDMVQETFLRALTKKDQFRGSSSERTWLTAILKNNIYDMLRRESKNNFLGGVDLSHENDETYFDQNGNWQPEAKPMIWHSDKLDPVEKKELSLVFDKCLSDLPVQWSSVFSMKHVDDAASEKICREHNITPSNLWTIMHRAKLKLRSCIERLWLK